ncbi:MAG: RNA polymerase factor sigma-54 [Acetobacteraceae bacterium]|nr:RNA polymerase factor sigma-54 [Acetobacteraceae bacterium]
MSGPFLGQRIEIRQGQTLVMTPQLRQAIKLLQYSNAEVSAFVEEEIEKNPLLERDERPELPDAERSFAPPEAPPRDSLEAVAADGLPEAASAALDIDWSNDFDAGGAADGPPPPGLDGGPGSGPEGGYDGAWSGRGGRSDFSDDGRGMEAIPDRAPSLREHLAEQLRCEVDDPADRLIGAHLIALTDDAGRLNADVPTIAARLGADAARVEAVLARMQQFDPSGIMARSLAECLAIQLREKDRLDPAMAMLLDNLELLARREHAKLMKLCGVDAEDLADMIAEIRKLDPKPGARFTGETAASVVPDVLMRAAPDGGWIVELNPDTLPRVLVSHNFQRHLARGAISREDRAYVQERLASANWLVKSLQQRATTILKVAGEIVRRQDGFFREGVSALRPLILRDIAETVAMHESTVSRVTSNKYIATPRGTLELKWFFTNAIAGSDGADSHSAESVRHRIRDLIAAEPAAAVLSDDQIVVILKREGVDIARRTVAKYRESLRIPSSVQRRREKAMPA